MKKVFQFPFAVALLIVFLTSGAFSQTVNEKLSLSITVDDANFYQRQSAKVHAKIKWGSVRGAKADGPRAVLFQLIKSGSNAKDCTLGDCFGATYSLRNRPVIRDRDSFEIDVDLNDLYWNDLISSRYDFDEPKNMAEAIQRGSYFLSMSVAFPAERPRKRIPRVIRISSNRILIQVK